MIVSEKSTLITGGSFNYFYDQLVLYSGENGSIFLQGANSISSSVALKLGEGEQTGENIKLKVYEGALGDSVGRVCWS